MVVIDCGAIYFVSFPIVKRFVWLPFLRTRSSFGNCGFILYFSLVVVLLRLSWLVVRFD